MKFKWNWLVLNSLLLLIVFSCLTSAQSSVPTWSNFDFAKHGETICEVDSGQVTTNCFETLWGLGIGFVNPVERLYPQIASFADWSEYSPSALPKDEAGLNALGGGILVKPRIANAVKAQLKELNVSNLSVYIPHPSHQLSEFPFALQIDWLDENRYPGQLKVIGTLIVVDKVFDLDLGHIFDFRDRFVSAIKIHELSGGRIPLFLTAGVDPTLEALNQVIAPVLAGKFVSLARIGFNKMESEIQRTLEEELRNQVRKGL